MTSPKLPAVLSFTGRTSEAVHVKWSRIDRPDRGADHADITAVADHGVPLAVTIDAGVGMRRHRAAASIPCESIP